MRHHYFSEFLLGDGTGSVMPPVADFAALCRTWSDRGRAGVTNLAAIPARFDQSNGARHYQLGDHASLGTVAFSDQDHNCFALRLAHPDDKDDHLQWTTEVCFAADKPANQTRVSVTTSIAETTGIVSPIPALDPEPDRRA